MVIKRNAFLVIAFLITGLAGAQDWDAYRVAGTLTSSDGRRMAIVELPGEKSTLVAEGDAVGEGYVAEISAEWLLIGGLDEGELRLPLSGGPAQSAPSLTQGDAVRDDPSFRRVPTTPLLIALDQISESLASQRAPQAAAAVRSEDDSEPQIELADHLRELLDLPPGVGIDNINGEEFTSVAEGLGMVERLLNEGTFVRLELESEEAQNPIYIFPE